MKKLFLFYIVIASTVSYMKAHNEKDYQNLMIEDDLGNDNSDNSNESDDNEFMLDDIADLVKGVEVKKQKPTCYDYAKVALHGWYLYCIQKPYIFCKTSLQKLGLYFTKRNTHGI